MVGWGTLLTLVTVLVSGSRAHAQTSVVFIDDGVPEADALAREALPGSDVVRLDDTMDPLAQIGRTLARRHDVTSVTIVSHGASGALQLGDQRIDSDALARRGGEVREWRSSLAPGADLLLYGCRVGEGVDGAAFVAQLASLSGADVAASTDETGEGDWTLEHRVGEVDAAAPWAPSVLTRWHHLLTTYTEGPDLSNTIAGATTIVLTSGSNTVSGTVTTPSDGQDNFLVQVPTGANLTAVSLTLNTGGSFNGSVTFNLNENRTSSGAFTVGLPLGPGSYYVQVIANFSVGNAWSMTFTVAGAAPVCGNGLVEGTEQCDDGNSTQCDGCSNTCTNVLNGCFIGGACIADGTLDPANQCAACRRTVSRTVYSPVVAGTACDDGQYCTISDACNGAGVCATSARNCADTLACTSDSCNETFDRCDHPVTSGCLIGGACIADGSLNPANACTHCAAAISTTTYVPTSAGSACDDGMFCTVGDACNGGGTCAAGPRDCTDTLSCTTDSCNESMHACVHPLAMGCLIGSACIPSGAADPTNPCMSCNPATSTTAYTPTASGVTCDDGQFCTVSDACNGTGTCAGTARDCSDSLSCTTDSCNEGAHACAHPVTSGCLIGGACIADGAADPTNGCRVCTPGTSTSAYSSAASGATCDDGLFCTTADACNGSGTCAGTARDCSDTSACTTDACDEAHGMCTSTPIAGCGDAGVDAGSDAGAQDGGTTSDGGVLTDAGVANDAGALRDTGARDARVTADGSAADGSLDDAGVAPVSSGGCGCRVGGTSSPLAPSALLALLAMVVIRRRARRG